MHAHFEKPESRMDALAADVLRRCARGELSPAVALVRLLVACENFDRLRATLAKLGGAGGDPDLQRAVERVHGLLARKQKSSALVLDMLQQERALTQPAEQADEIERCRHLFERLVERNAEASVALYSLGEPGLLDAATREVVDLLERLGLLGPERCVLEIGCGIGRFQEALAGRVAAIVGVDIAPAMIEAARRRCAGLPNVTLLETSGRDLRSFRAASFDLVLAIDAMPYVYRVGAALVAAHFAEAARVLHSGGDFLIMNLSYRGDLDLDRNDVRRLAAATRMRVLRNGTSDLRLWDGATFHLRKAQPAV